MADYADLEIALTPEGNDYRVRMRLSIPHKGVRSELLEPALAYFDLDALGDVANQPQEYGKLLAESLLTAEGASKAGEFFGQARSVAASHDVKLRVRLRIEEDGSALHQLRWETICDPQNTDAWLGTDENLLLSRFLPTRDMRPTKTRPGEDRKPLVVIANPTDREAHNLDPVDVRHQLILARDSLGSIGLGGQPLDALYRLDEGEEPVPNVEHLGPPTLKNLVKQLRGRPEVLYLLCHGRLEEEALEGGGTRKVPKLWLEKENGTADKVSALKDDNDPEKRAGLVTHISQGTQLPRLIILASCQSAGEA
ncbi:MAG: CHAT domain-containing protein, partial [Anaerolineae bacterium]